MHGTKQSLTIGQTLTYRVGRIEISLQRTEHTYTVTTTQGGTLRIGDNSGAYATEAEARAVARIYAEAYRAEATKTLTDTVPAGTHRQVAPTMAGAQLAKVSDPQALILAAAASNGGIIARSAQATVTQLQALARKGLATLNYQSGRGKRRVVESATLTKRGYAAAVKVA